MKGGSWAIALGASLCATAPAYGADLFELQVFHADISAPGEASVELHSNYAVEDSDVAPALRGHVHEMIESTLGVSRNWEVGAHLLATVGPGVADWAGARVRAKFRLPIELAQVQFAANVELSYMPTQFADAGWYAELRPVAEWRLGHWDVDLNPVLCTGVGGSALGKVLFEPAANLRYELGEMVSAGLEYYCAFGDADQLPTRRGGHYVFETVDLLPRLLGSWYVRFGIGQGVSHGSSPWVATSVFGHRF
jgi:hypothetical protein